MNKLSSYVSFVHGMDLEYIKKIRPENVLILDPDVQQISDIHKASSDSTITIRVWELDDGRTDQNPEGVYKQLREDPELLGQVHAQMFIGIVKNFERQAKERNLPFPDREQLTVHLINEPDTNHLMDQVNTYTINAVKSLDKEFIPAEVFNFGTGHPALLNSNQEPDWSPVHEVIELITGTRHIAVTHEYFNDLGLSHPSLNPWHIKRHHWAPIGPRYRIGEFGLDMLLNGRMNHHQGWNGIIPGELYKIDVDQYISWLRRDFLSVRVYMTGFAGGEWESFDTRPISSELAKIYYESEVIPGPDPMNPPTKRNFDIVIEKVLNFEGGYTNDPNDPGNWTGGEVGVGELKGTKYGISAASYPRLDIKNISIDQAKNIYFADYWLKSGANLLELPLALVHFDSAVNAGPGQANIFLNQSNKDYVRYMAVRTIWYTQLRDWNLFGRAWTKRNGELLLDAEELAQKQNG